MNPSSPATRVLVYLGEVVGYVIGNDKSLVDRRAIQMKADFLEVINSSPGPNPVGGPVPTISRVTTHPPLNHEEQQSLDNGLVVVI